MKTNLKVAMTAVAIVALASPVMAKSASHGHVAPSAISNAYGSAAGARTAPVTEGNKIYVNDAVHVTFPQQGD